MSTFCGSIELTDTGVDVLAGSTPHINSDVLKRDIVARGIFYPLPKSNKEVCHQVGVWEYLFKTKY